MTRGVLVLSLMILILLGIWWLAAMPTLVPGANPIPLSTDALRAVWMTQVLTLVMLAPRLGAMRGHREAAIALACGTAISWPVVALMASATSLSAWAVVRSEAAIVAVAVLLPVAGQALNGLAARLKTTVEPRLLVTFCSVIGVSMLWWTHETWVGWLT